MKNEKIFQSYNVYSFMCDDQNLKLTLNLSQKLLPKLSQKLTTKHVKNCPEIITAGAIHNYCF